MSYSRNYHNYSKRNAEEDDLNEEDDDEGEEYDEEQTQKIIATRLQRHLEKKLVKLESKVYKQSTILHQLQNKKVLVSAKTLDLPLEAFVCVMMKQKIEIKRK